MADVMSAILREEPPELSETNAKISPALDKIGRRREGKELFYLAPDYKLMAVKINLKGTDLEVGAARALSDTRPAGYPYDVTPDGQHFLIATPPERKEAAPITLVQNWALGVKK